MCYPKVEQVESNPVVAGDICSALGAGGRAFKSPRPDQFLQSFTSGIVRLNTSKTPCKRYPNCYPIHSLASTIGNLPVYKKQSMAQGKTYEPTPADREAVLLLAGAGATEQRICQVVKCDPKTLRKHFRRELDTGKSQITTQAVSTLVKAMKGGGKGSVTAAIFWLKTRERWTERSELTGADGAPLGAPGFPQMRDALMAALEGQPAEVRQAVGRRLLEMDKLMHGEAAANGLAQ